MGLCFFYYLRVFLWAFCVRLGIFKKFVGVYGIGFEVNCGQ